MSRRDQPAVVSPRQSHRLSSRWESPRFGDIVGAAPWQKRWSDISKYRFKKRRQKRSDVRDENNLEDSSLSCSWSHPPNQKSAVFFGMSIGHFSKKAVVAILSRHRQQKHWYVTKNQKIANKLTWNFERIGFATRDAERPILNANSVADPRMRVVVEIQIVGENPRATRVFHMVVEKPILPNKICTNTSNPPVDRSRQGRKYTLLWPHRY